MALSASTARSGSSRRRMAAILIPALTALTLSAPAALGPWAQAAALRSPAPAARTAPSPTRIAGAAHPATRLAAQVKAGTNLLLNPKATVGDASAQGWDAVTIPGWQVQAGLPTVVRYGTPGFPRLPTAAKWPSAGGRLFAGGAGGTASLVQVIPLRRVATGTRFSVGAWLGGTKTSDAVLKLRFLGAGGRVLSAITLGPAGGRARAPLRHRTATGDVPAGAATAKVTLLLRTTFTRYNGPEAPQAGYDDAAAGGLRLALSRPVASRAALTPTKPEVPRYQHVFLFYLENEDFGQVIGNTRQAPYLNSLTRQGVLLTGFYAEEHPSDGNYLAFAGGSAFGVPLDDPAEENPLYTISARNIGDLITDGGETWKSYTQGANGPCDDTVHGYYWNDDQPMLYFKDVRDRPAYCASHVVPLEELPGDLASAATTASFSWIAPDDCSDMEGCGIAAGDEFVRAQLTRIMNSPAWRTQRSLAIITFDEDAQDYQHPAQRVPTIVLASQGVRRGITDPTRYTHYGVLRTVEAALGLGTLTANDRYATAFSKIFLPERLPASAAPPSRRPETAGPAAPGTPRARRSSTVPLSTGRVLTSASSAPILLALPHGGLDDAATERVHGLGESFIEWHPGLEAERQPCGRDIGLAGHRLIRRHLCSLFSAPQALPPQACPASSAAPACPAHTAAQARHHRPMRKHRAQKSPEGWPGTRCSPPRAAARLPCAGVRWQRRPPGSVITGARLPGQNHRKQ
ncbi:MAG TPA: alkaline phosphatase family protein [Trebonia sp.]|nr:alkaline phosphatase family protein [Trebonia sp.]